MEDGIADKLQFSRKKIESAIRAAEERMMRESSDKLEVMGVSAVCSMVEAVKRRVRASPSQKRKNGVNAAPNHGRPSTTSDSIFTHARQRAESSMPAKKSAKRSAIHSDKKSAEPARPSAKKHAKKNAKPPAKPPAKPHQYRAANGEKADRPGRCMAGSKSASDILDCLSMCCDRTKNKRGT